MFFRNAAVWAVALSITISTVVSDNASGKLSDKVARAEGEDGV